MDPIIQIILWILSLPLFAMILWYPPKSRMGYTLWSATFGALAVLSIAGLLSTDFVLRSGLSEKEKKKDLAVSTFTQIGIACSAALMGGVATNLFVAGLSLPWRDTSDSKALEELEDEFNERSIRLIMEAIGDKTRLMTDDQKALFLDGVEHGLMLAIYSPPRSNSDRREALAQQMELIRNLKHKKSDRK